MKAIVINMYSRVTILGILVALLLGVVLFFQYDKNETVSNIGTADSNLTAVPKGLRQQFPNTRFENSDPRIVNAISGGPKKDGILALDKPKFDPLADFSGNGDMQVIVIEQKGEVKIYPYNILTWHEVVNDTVGGEPLAITFCPLCGSALVFARTLPDGTVTTFGVSGFLLESNMIMFDRTTETLWQQSTGEALAGTYRPHTLKRVPFQLITLADAKTRYVSASILSEDTGQARDYARNPYAGYETNDRFVFDPSSLDSRLPPKTIMVIFYHKEAPVAVPWLKLREKGTATLEIEDTSYTLQVSDIGELSISKTGFTGPLPFYFEMWFSAAAQHSDTITLISLE